MFEDNPEVGILVTMDIQVIKEDTQAITGDIQAAGEEHTQAVEEDIQATEEEHIQAVKGIPVVKNTQVIVEDSLVAALDILAVVGIQVRMEDSLAVVEHTQLAEEDNQAVLNFSQPPL